MPIQVLALRLVHNLAEDAAQRAEDEHAHQAEILEALHADSVPHPLSIKLSVQQKPHCAVTLLHWNAAACAPVAFSRDLAFPSVQGPGSQGFLDQPVSTWITCTP